MPRRRTPASRLAALAAWGLALVLLERAMHADSTAAMVLQSVVLVAAALGAAKMWLHNCFESHLVVIVTVVATAGGTLLALTVGMPGDPPVAPAPPHLLALLLSATAGAALVADAHARRADGTPAQPPYAL